jgi:ribosomal protein S18 acetylase RimI-like enzyme
MVRDLRADPPPPGWADAPGPPGVSFTALEGRPDALFEAAWTAAYAPGRVDHVPGEVPSEFLDAVLSGRAAGPLQPYARVAWADGGVVGAIVMTDQPPRAFVADVFRDPDPRWRGLGQALLQRAVAAAAAAGAPSVALSVTDGNPAERLYERLGFRRIGTRTVIQRPLR